MHFIQHSSCKSSHSQLTCSWEITALVTKCCSCSLAKLIQSCSKLFTPRSYSHRQRNMLHTTKKCMAGLLLLVDINLKTVDVHYSHGAVHLCGTQPVIDLLQQPVEQHWVQGFGNGISATRNTTPPNNIHLLLFLNDARQSPKHHITHSLIHWNKAGCPFFVKRSSQSSDKGQENMREGLSDTTGNTHTHTHIHHLFTSYTNGWFEVSGGNLKWDKTGEKMQNVLPSHSGCIFCLFSFVFYDKLWQAFF